MALLGRVLVVGLLGGTASPVDLALVLGRRLSILGSTLRTRSAQERRRLAAAMAAELLPRFSRGELTAVVDEVLPAASAPEALDRLKRNASFGKLVLEWRS
jgi:NADPH:quinone reductase-like Zn-dependent oxidoreductase